MALRKNLTIVNDSFYVFFLVHFQVQVLSFYFFMLETNCNIDFKNHQLQDLFQESSKEFCSVLLYIENQSFIRAFSSIIHYL